MGPRNAGWIGAVLACALVAGCGDDGADGASCTVTQAEDGGALIACEDGSSVSVPAGSAGTGGTDGMAGTAGESCSVEAGSAGGALITCDDGSSVQVPAGTAGPAGEAGVPGEPGPEGPVFRAAGPGLNFEIVSASIDDERHPVATVRFTDGEGIPLDREGIFSEGAISVSFTVVAIPVADDGGAGPYIAYLSREATGDVSGIVQQPTSEGDGEWTWLDPPEGLYRYRFNVQLPEGYDASLTHQIAAYASRELDQRYVSNDAFGFVPNDADAPTIVRAVAETDTCNQCHAPLALHGSRRLELQLCLACHTQGAVDPDTGNSIDFNVMIHKIHMGSDLPSVKAGMPYQIIGYRQSVHDYSDVVFPQGIDNCETCHDGPDGEWFDTRPSLAVCRSCHDNVWFGPEEETPAWMAYHLGGPLPATQECGNCHQTGALPNGQCGDSGAPDCSPRAVHYTPISDPDAPTFLVDQLAVDVSGGVGAAPTLTFRARHGTNGTGLTDAVTEPGDLERFYVYVTGPNTEYLDYLCFGEDEDCAGDVVGFTHDGSGEFSLELPQTLQQIADALCTDPLASESRCADAANDSFTVSLRARFDGRYTVNPSTRFTVASGDDALETRRQVVSTERCNTCHLDLGAHGGAQKTVEQCAVCHRPSFDTRGRQTPPESGTADTTSLRFGHMVHRIHGAEIAGDAFIAYGYRGPPHAEVDLSDVRFPGDASQCETCHLEGTYTLPLSSDVPASTQAVIDSSGDAVSLIETPPTAALCAGCHANASTRAHAEINTTASGVETCVTCHGPGREFDVEAVHGGLSGQ